MEKRSISTLGFALLGLLARDPRSGYDLARLMRVPVGLFWKAGHSQIYPELARLERLGLVTHERVEQLDRPNKKTFSITPAGRRELQGWLVQPNDPPINRDALVLKAFCIWLADPLAAARLFREHADFHRAQLDYCQQQQDEIRRRFGREMLRVDSPRFADYIATERGIGYHREYERWCLWVAELLERSAGAPAEG